jgi:hypothetical protein
MTYVNNVTDTLYADVSYANPPVDDSYTAAGYRVLAMRSNDGTVVDTNFAANYAWCVNAVNSGAMDFFLCYFFWRSNWQTTINNHMSLVNGAGGPHPRMVSMIDVETDGGNNPTYDVSSDLNSTMGTLASWLGSPARVIGYGNTGDLSLMWPTMPLGLRLVVAGYGEQTSYPGQVAHQYTNGTGYGAASGLPDGAPPFGNCDMNSADGLSSIAFAAACGITIGVPVAPTPPPVTPPPVVVTPPPATPVTLPTDDSIFGATAVLAAQLLA